MYHYIPAVYLLIFLSLCVTIYLIVFPDFIILLPYYSVIFHIHICLSTYKSPPLHEIQIILKQTLRLKSSALLFYTINTFV